MRAAYLETSDPGEYLDATPPSGVQVSWLHRPEPGSRPQLLAGALAAGPWLSGRADVFAHGERESMKASARRSRPGSATATSFPCRATGQRAEPRTCSSPRSASRSGRSNT
jgi:NADPH-dependent ferric siderophore reductase